MREGSSIGDFLKHEFSLSQIETSTPFTGQQLLPGQGTATRLIPNAPPVPDIPIGDGLSVPGAPPSQTRVTRQSFLSGFLSNLGPSIEGAMRAPRGSGIAGGIAGGFAGIEEENRYQQNLAMQRTEQERKNLLEQSTLRYQDTQTAHLNAEIEALRRKPADKFLTTFADASGNQTALFQSPSGSPYTVKVGTAKPAEGQQPLGDRISQLNEGLTARYQVLNPGANLPSAFLLKANATEKDFQNIDKMLEATEKARGTVAQQNEVRALREQTAALVNQGKGEKPVIAFNPKTGQRVLSTAAEARASGLANPVSVSETDIEKESATTKQLNDVQMNVSRYQNAVNAIPGSISQKSVNHMARILSNDVVNSTVLSPVGMATLPSILEQGARAADWNALTPEEQQATIGYLRAKGSIIAFQKALTQVGRTSKEALEIEMNNLPSPLVGATVANKQLAAFQENVDTASQGLTKVPWLETPKDVRQRIESQAQVARPQKTSGQFKGRLSQDAGESSFRPGMSVLIHGNVKKIAKVYPDGTFDVEP